MPFYLDTTSHQYWRGRERIVGVTEGLELVGVLNTQWFDDRKTERGSRVHRAVAFWNENARCAAMQLPLNGDVLYATEDAPALQAYGAFLADYDPLPLLIERPLYHEVLRYGGQPDLACLLRRSVPHAHHAVIDLKSGAPEPWHELQLSLYFELCRVNRVFGPAPQTPRLYGLYLRPHGARPYWLKSYRFNPVAISMMATAQWRLHHQL